MACCCDTGKQIFGCNHPLYASAHAAWLRNRCRVSFGQTAHSSVQQVDVTLVDLLSLVNVFLDSFGSGRVIRRGFQLFGWVRHKQ